MTHVELGASAPSPSPSFTQANGCSGSNHRCDFCSRKWGDHIAPGIRCPDGEKIAAFKPNYTSWRHGGWYVTNCQYPSGAVGCVSRNYPDRKWRIVGDDRRTGDLGEPGDFTFKNRDDAARAEYALVLGGDQGR